MGNKKSSRNGHCRITRKFTSGIIVVIITTMMTTATPPASATRLNGDDHHNGQYAPQPQKQSNCPKFVKIYSDILKLTRRGNFGCKNCDFVERIRKLVPNFLSGLASVWNLHNRRSLGGEIGKVFYCQIICCAPLPAGIIHKYPSCTEFV